MYKGPEEELRFFLKPLGSLERKEMSARVLRQKIGMEVAEAETWLWQHLGRR